VTTSPQKLVVTSIYGEEIMMSGSNKSPSHLDRPEGRIAYEIAGDGPLVVLVPGVADRRGGYRFLCHASKKLAVARRIDRSP
jgi:hypothetical protein